MNCSEMLEVMLEVICGDDPGEKFVTHLQKCYRCKVAWEELLENVSLIGETINKLKVSEDEMNSIRARVLPKK